MDNFVYVTKRTQPRNINTKLYDNLFVGYEFEFNSRDDASTGNRKLIEVFDIPSVGKFYGKHNNKIKKLINSQGIKLECEFTVPVSRYIERDHYVADIYNDGTVNHEVVTIPQSPHNLDIVKKNVYDIINNTLQGVDYYSNGKGGLHQTFLLGYPSMHESSWDGDVVFNIGQFMRAFIVEMRYLFCGIGKTTRSCNYCNYVDFDTAKYCSACHGDMINIRKNNTKIWGIEMRFPDGKNDWEMIQLETKFISAMIRQMAYLSKYGILRMATDRTKFQEETYSEIEGLGREGIKKLCIQCAKDYPKSKGLQVNSMIELLKPSLEHYGIYEDILYLAKRGVARSTSSLDSDESDLMCDYINSRLKLKRNEKTELKTLRSKFKKKNIEIQQTVRRGW